MLSRLEHSELVLKLIKVSEVIPNESLVMVTMGVEK